MGKRKAFTLIELMVVILIIGILTALVAPPLLRRVREAKWSEAKATAGAIATALRAYWSENGGRATATVLGPCTTAADFEKIGLMAGDIEGTYFGPACYSTSALTTDSPGTDAAVPHYTITVTASNSSKPGHPSGTLTLNHLGVWTGP
jgi:prepilin-type N-terminal cleavage/methylation domain-containing protein